MDRRSWGDMFKHRGTGLGFLDLRGRVLLSIVFGVFAAVICGVLSFLTATTLTRQIDEQIRRRLRDDVLLGASKIDADLHETLRRPEQQGGAAYRMLQSTLQELQRSLEDVEYVYTMRQDEQGRITFVVDEETNETEIAHLGEIYTDAGPRLRECFATMDRPVVENEPYTDHWGTWLSGYAPFHTTDGRRSGVLGMDIKAADVAAARMRAFRTAGIVFAAFMPLCGLLGWLLAGWLMAPLRRQVAEASNLIHWFSVPRSRATPASEVGSLVAAIRTLASVLDGIRDSVVATTMEGTVIYCNEAACRSLGKARREFLGCSVESFGEDSGKGATQKEILLTTREQGTWQGEVINRTADGRDIVFESRTQVFLDETGAPLGIVGLSTDVTEKRRAEEERKALDAELRHARRLEVVGLLAGGVAHEINNPINGIMNYAQLIRDRLEGKPETVDEFAGEIIHETERVATIVKNLLSFARQDYHGQDGVRLCDLVDGTLSLLRSMLRHDHIALDVAVPAELPALRCCGQQIQEVLMNLVTNARDTLNEKYPDDDENKRISVTASEIERNGRKWVRMTVEDHGCGVPESARERLFDPFFTTKKPDRGTGLGLSISHGIVKNHGGDLSVESEPGEWTRFHVVLPVDNG